MHAASLGIRDKSSPVDMQRKKCIACGHEQGGGLECFRCPSTALELVPCTEAPAAKEVPWYRGKRSYLEIDSPLVAGCGGKVPERGVIVVTGPGGAGKTSLVVKAMLELRRMGKTLGALDAEMGDELANYTYRRAGATTRDLRAIRRRTDEQGHWSKLVDALDVDVVLVDSLHEWIEHSGNVVRLDCGRKGRLAKRSLVFVVAHFARAGHVKGSTTTDHRGDAMIIVDHEQIEVQKCTWARSGVVTKR